MCLCTATMRMLQFPCIFCGQKPSFLEMRKLFAFRCDYKICLTVSDVFLTAHGVGMFLCCTSSMLENHIYIFFFYL